MCIIMIMIDSVKISQYYISSIRYQLSSSLKKIGLSHIKLDLHDRLVLIRFRL